MTIFHLNIKICGVAVCLGLFSVHSNSMAQALNSAGGGAQGSCDERLGLVAQYDMTVETIRDGTTFSSDKSKITATLDLIKLVSREEHSKSREVYYGVKTQSSPYGSTTHTTQAEVNNVWLPFAGDVAHPTQAFGKNVVMNCVASKGQIGVGKFKDKNVETCEVEYASEGVRLLMKFANVPFGHLSRSLRVSLDDSVEIVKTSVLTSCENKSPRDLAFQAHELNGGQVGVSSR